MYIIIKIKLIKHTKDIAKIVLTLLGSLLLILGLINIKYKTAYVVTISGMNLGYIENIEGFQNQINDEVLNQEGTNIENIALIQEPSYEKKIVSRDIEFSENDIINNIKENNTVITYSYYEISLNDTTKTQVDSLEEAEKVVNQIKNEFDGDELELNLQINKIYTENEEECNTESLEVASNTVEVAATEIKEKVEEEKNTLGVVNEVRLSVLPVTGKITSRYGERSSIRSSTHTGLDIACASGTQIKAVSAGKVIFAGYKGSYGNLLRIDHGNGVETWYGHCSKLLAKEGDAIEVGDIIALVGSTGNSTGPHLHFEIRINGETVNPQNYVYNK